MRICSRCSRETPDEGQFCMSCGAEMSAPPAPYQSLEPQTSGKAIISLVSGLFALIPPAAILAIVLGHISRSEIRKSAGRLKGAGMALAGLIFGYAGLVFLPFLLIIAAIAIPNLLRARMAANQASAVGSLRVLCTAAETYAATFEHGFPHSLTDLGPPAGNETRSAQAADLIDSFLASGRKSGYEFTYVPGEIDSNGYALAYTIHADPLDEHSTGRDHYFADQTGIIRMERYGPATVDSPYIH